MNNKTKTDKLFDYIYQNKKQVLLYFVWAIICSILRSVLGVIISPVVTAGG